MIIKSKSRKKPSFNQLLTYMMNDQARLHDENGEGFVLLHNVHGETIDEWVEEFKENETFRLRRRSDSTILTHEMLSWHCDNKLTPQMMVDMTREYINQRNPNGMFVAVPHMEKEHYHVHLCVSGVEYRSGKSMRMSHEKFRQVKQRTQNYQKQHYPRLSKSVVNHGRGDDYSNDVEFQITKRGGQTKKEQLIKIVEECYKKAKSLDDFLKRLKKKGIKTYDRSGRLTGVWFGGRKYRFKRLGIDLLRLEKDKGVFKKIRNRRSSLIGMNKSRL